MLETVNLGAELGKKEYGAAMDKRDLELARLQRKARADGAPVLLVLEGWHAAGKGVVLSRLLQPLDARGYVVHNVGPPTEEERLRPPLWRFWNRTPEDGQVAIFNHGWHGATVRSRVGGDAKGHAIDAAWERARVFERQLAESGAAVVKIFLHISEKEQGKRFKKLAKAPAFSWKVGKEEKKQHKDYDDWLQAWEEMLRETSTPCAPWTMVSATDERFAVVRVAETLVSALENRLSRPAPRKGPSRKRFARRTSPLDRVDLGQALDKAEYSDKLDDLQKELRRLQHLCYVERKPVVILYEGWDAAGKGGNIRRLIRELDPRGYDVVPVAAPEGAEKRHHYLWRFWRSLPKAGHFAIYDRSWYGRVLVERVEGFATPAEWRRAYREINEFEKALADYGTVLVKFWVHISKEEQLARFEARQQTPSKRWKITDEDWRNREKWDAYYDAVSDTLEQTSTVDAPWTIVAGNDKRFARVQALETVTDAVRRSLEAGK